MSGFQVTPSTFQVNEGESLTTSLTGFTPGSTLYFKVTGRGISKKDFASGGVKGRVQVDSNGVASISHTLRADKKTEGEESFAIQVFSDKKMRNLRGESDSVSVLDTSVKAGKGGDKNTNKDPLTGEVIFGMPYGYDLVPTNGKGSYARYFLKANPTTPGFDIYGDTDKSLALSAADKYLGFANAISIDSSVQGESGTFRVDSSGNTLEVFIREQSVGLLSSSNVGF